MQLYARENSYNSRPAASCGRLEGRRSFVLVIFAIYQRSQGLNISLSQPIESIFQLPTLRTSAEDGQRVSATLYWYVTHQRQVNRPWA